MSLKSPSQLKILNDTLDLMTLMTHASCCNHRLNLLRFFASKRERINYYPYKSTKNVKKMRKVMMMMAMLAVSFAAQAQSKFHDVEANEATGRVKSITTNMMGRDIVINFSEDGKMQGEGVSDAVYDAEGYLQSAKQSMMNQSVVVKYKWENGRVASQTMNMMGNDMEMKYTYDDKGFITAQTMDMGGQQVSIPLTDYKFDDHGNWISRKMSMMGNEMEQVRKIEYYE